MNEVYGRLSDPICFGQHSSVFRLSLAHMGVIRLQSGAMPPSDADQIGIQKTPIFTLKGSISKIQGTEYIDELHPHFRAAVGAAGSRMERTCYQSTHLGFRNLTPEVSTNGLVSECGCLDFGLERLEVTGTGDWQWRACSVRAPAGFQKDRQGSFRSSCASCRNRVLRPESPAPADTAYNLCLCFQMCGLMTVCQHELDVMRGCKAIHVILTASIWAAC